MQRFDSCFNMIHRQPTFGFNQIILKKAKARGTKKEWKNSEKERKKGKKGEEEIMKKSNNSRR